ncbi:MAG: VOC family protein, partial [Bacteroidota bacterium]
GTQTAMSEQRGAARNYKQRHMPMRSGRGRSGSSKTYIKQHGQGVHHLAFHTEDIQQEGADLAAKGFRFTADQPSDGADNKLIRFIHPRAAGGVLVELCQDKS